MFLSVVLVSISIHTLISNSLASCDFLKDKSLQSGLNTEKKFWEKMRSMSQNPVGQSHTSYPGLVLVGH